MISIAFCRNATLELLTDRRDGDSKSRQSSQSSNRDSAFENLALSVERDVQPLNGVSSFHNDLLCSEQNDRLQVSVASGSSSAEVNCARIAQGVGLQTGSTLLYFS